MTTAARADGNTRTAKRLLLAVLAMLGFSFAMVPFYNVFCRAMGIQQDRVAIAETATPGWQQKVWFDANVASNVPAELVPLDHTGSGHPGSLIKARFQLRNLGATALDLRAVPSYAPVNAVRYVEKLQCFCFNALHLAPHETREVTVVMLLKPELPASLGPIVLSYSLNRLDTAVTPDTDGARQAS